MNTLKTGKLISWLLIIAICGYVGLFSVIAYLKYNSFSFHDIDLAVINQVFWNTVRGEIAVKSFGSATILGGGHVFLIAFILSPIYFLAQSPLTLLFLQSLALGLGAWPVFLIAREFLKPGGGLVMAICYLLYPALHYVNLFEFHPIAFATPLLLGMFLFYLRKKWWLFVLFTALSLSCREDVAIPVFGMGIFGLIQVLGRPQGERRGALKWGLLPLFSSAIWFVFCIKFLQPHFLMPIFKQIGLDKGGLAFYSWLGDTPTEVLKTIILDPGKVLSGIVIKPKMLYLYHLFVPVGFLSIFSPGALLLTLIPLTEGLLSQRPTHFSIHYQYSSIITPFIFISAIYGIRNILSWKKITGNKSLQKIVPIFVLIILLVSAIISAATFGPLLHLPDKLKLWRITREDRVRQNLVEEVPSQAPVIATFEFSPKLSMRPQLFYFYHVYSASRHPDFKINVTAAQEFCQYALIDFNDYLTFYDFFTPGGDKDVYKFLEGGTWRLKTTINSIALFEKGDQVELGIVKKIPPGQSADLRTVSGCPQLKLAGISIKIVSVLGQPTISLSVDLKCQAKLTDNLLLLARFSNPVDRSNNFQQFFFAPYRIFPTSRWEPGSIIRQSCNILVPENSPSGDYDLTLTLIRKRPNLSMPGQLKELFYNYFDTAMAMSALPARWGVPPDRFLEQILVARASNAITLK